MFEFTKRKRWADLLITELTEAIILVLSSDGIVWYCGNAVHDLLGWRDDEVIDREFLDIMNGQSVFLGNFLTYFFFTKAYSLFGGVVTSGRPSEIPIHVPRID